METWLVYGHQGWIGNYFCSNFPSNLNVKLVFPTSRADDIDGVAIDLDHLKPNRVISFIGRTGGPGCNTIDYLEGKLEMNIRDNLFSPVVLMKLCEMYQIHFTYLGTGCIFSYDSPDDEPFTEESKPNFFGSSYSIVKGFTDQLTILFPNVLNIRIRMPITSKDESKNFISKIIRYPRILNTLNSMTVLPDLFPILIGLIRTNRVGTVNLVNPGPTDHVAILELYKKYIDPNHTYTLIEESEHDSMLKSKRSKNVLIPTFDAPDTIQSIERIFQNKATWKGNVADV